MAKHYTGGNKLIIKKEDYGNVNQCIVGPKKLVNKNNDEQIDDSSCLQMVSLGEGDRTIVIAGVNKGLDKKGSMGHFYPN